MTIRNVIVACDYAYIEGGAARVAVQTAVELSKRSNLKVYFFYIDLILTHAYNYLCDYFFLNIFTHVM